MVLSQAEAHPGAGHRARLRDKFLAHGLVKFTDEEVLELLLTLATPRQDCKRQARELFARFGSLRGVLEAEPAALAEVKGVGPKNVLGLKLVPAAARRYLEDRLRTAGWVWDASEAEGYLLMTMGALDREVFRLILLDADRRVIGVEDLFLGTADFNPVYPREVIARALKVDARAVVCAHNHPRSPAQPTAEDLDITRRLYHACRGVGLEFADHLIVGAGAVYSFAGAGGLVGPAAECDTLGL